VARLLEILENGVYSPELRFKEYGTDLVSSLVNSVSSLFVTNPPAGRPRLCARLQPYHGQQLYRTRSVNTGQVTGNPNEIMIRLTEFHRPFEDVIDTIIHESTHKFLGTEYEGTQGASFNWIRNDGLALYLQNNPGIPLPMHTPNFLGKNSDQAIANAYLLAAYILYLPEGDVTARTELNLRVRLESQTAIGQTLRNAIAARRPPGD
jgi:hypothetical protein